MPGVMTGQKPTFQAYNEGHARLQHRLEQPGAVAESELDAGVSVRASSARCSAPRRRHGPARRLRAGLRASWHVGLLRRVRRQPWRHAHGQPEHDARQPGPGRARPAGAAPRHGAGSAPPSFPLDAAVSVHRRRHRRRERVRSAAADAVYADVDGQPRTQGRRATSASTCATSAPATSRAGRPTTSTRSTSSRTGS